MTKKKYSKWKVGALIIVLICAVASVLFADYYQKIFSAAADVSENNQYVYVKSDWTRADLVLDLYISGVLEDTAAFIWVANRKSFHSLKPGKYRLKNKMSNNELINLFRSGNQEMVQLSFHGIRSLDALAARVSKQIEADSASLYQLFTSTNVAGKYGFNRKTFMCMFIPNTYEFYWSTTAESFVKRMAREYKRFWTDERKAKARALSMRQSEVSILASLVQSEQMEHPEERPRVAGLYINRLKRGIRLQSDPTLIHALINDPSVNTSRAKKLRQKGEYPKRVLTEDLQITSKYNTYVYAGLPPGPILVPEISSLKSVLNYEEHNYLYMCAKADFSGYHNFARTLSQHNVNARAYRNELNKRGIYH